MSKELIVSATRHETRVAVLEDDQVVEIFHQREQEYSLAGSIHKGRVTRVLPGMQSAFVDIGLERDAFLYVSDFFEDNDEYDKIVTTVEDKVLRLEKDGPAPTLSEEALVIVETDQPTDPVGAVATPAPERREPREDRGGRDGGRGGRGRRRGRRGGQGPGGGIPDSKYFSPNARTEERTPITQDTTAPEEPDETSSFKEDLVVLPGESLAKYTGEARQEETRKAEPSATLPLEMASVDEDIEPAQKEPPPEEPDEVPVIPDPSEDEIVPDPIAEPDEEPIDEPEDDTPGISEPDEDEPYGVEEPLNFAAEPESSGAPDTVAVMTFVDGEPDSLILLEADAQSKEETAEESIGEGSTREEAVGEEAVSEGAVGEGIVDEETEGPEPARTPTSLTATLREQGPRFQHRVSRRTRRKSRTGQEPRTDQPAREIRVQEPRTEPRSEPRTETRTDNRSEGRSEARSEGKEEARNARPPLPSISDLLHEGQEIVVQIAKEPLGQKGARITSHVALPGRFLVYMPSVDHVGVSRKIPSDDERLRLKKILQTHRVGIPGGFIVRTAGDGRTEEELRADMMFLYNLWTDMRQKVDKKPAPQLMHHDLDVVQRILRDQLTSAFKTVWVDNEEFYESVLRFVQRFQPAMVSRVKLYTRPTPIFDEFGVTAELEKALKPKVWLKSGGYIVINQTEALVAIDINTGKYVGKSNRLEDTIVKTNTDAIKEIVRQIRLRDLGGIIVVDFIDMDERKNRQKVMLALEEAMRVDRAPYKILQFNDFGLVAITRKRVKQSLERTLCAPCPYCEGAGYIKSVQTVVGEILVEAHKIRKAVEGEDVMLRVNPEVAKVLKSNSNDFLQEIEETLGKTVMVKSDPSLHQTKFDLA